MHTYTLTLVLKTLSTYHLRCDDHSGQPPKDFPLDGAAVHAFITRCDKQYKAGDTHALRQLGQELYTWLEDGTQGCLSQLRRRGPQTALHLDGEAGLRQLPWELLHDGQAFWCAGGFIPVRRAAAFAAHPREVLNRPLRGLFMASSPEDVPPVLDSEREEARILEATRGIELLVEESGSLAGLHRMIADYPAGWFDVVHLTGHADVDGAHAFFWLEDDYGRKQKAGAEDLTRAFNGRFPRLLFLSGCQTGRPAAGLPSLSEALVQAGTPAVLGWALPVGDAAATQAAAALYEQLAIGERLDAAVAATRQALLEANSGYWHLLRLYANADPLAELVTAPRTLGREKLKAREAAMDFLDAEQRVKVCPRTAFVGRRRLLQRALRVLRAVPGETDYTPGLLLHGMGGLGKSSLAARLCDRLSPTHPHWVWFGGIDEDSLRQVVADKARNPQVNALLNEPDLSLAQQLTEVLEKLPQPVLFVFDDFEHNAEQESAATTEASAARFLPRTRSDGSLILREPAATALRAVLDAIEESQSESRVIVTCRQRLSALPLHEIGLTSMQGADWDKKTRALPAFAETSPATAELQAKARSLAAGNPRLVEWLDKVLGDRATDSAALLARLEHTTEAFREDTLLAGLLDQLPTPMLRTLALLALYELPVPNAALVAVADIPEHTAPLTRLISLGLVEHWRVSAHDWYFASPLLTPLLEQELSAEERRTALQLATHALYHLWWQAGDGISETQALEIRRLAHLAGEQTIAAEITERIATGAVNNHRYREA